jgi:cytochrome P450
MGWEWSPVMMNPSKELNKLRTYMRQALGPQAVPRYRPFIQSEVTILLKSLIGFEGDPAEALNT